MNIYCAYETSEKVCQMQGDNPICTQFNSAFVADIKPGLQCWQNSYVEHQSKFDNANLIDHQQHEYYQNLRKNNESYHFTQWNKIIPFSDDKHNTYKDCVASIATEQKRFGPVTSKLYPTVGDVLLSPTSNTNTKKLLNGMDSSYSDNSKKVVAIHFDNSDTETIHQGFKTSENCTAVNEVLLHPNTSHAITVNEQPLYLHCQLNNNNEEIGSTNNSHKSPDNALSFQMFVRDFDVCSKPSICQLCGDACANEEIMRLHICRHIATTACGITNYNIASTNQTSSMPSSRSGQNELATHRCYVKLYNCIDMLSSQRTASHDTQNSAAGTNGNIHESTGTSISEAYHDQNTSTAVAESYKCQECQAIFKRKSSLKQHLQIHLQPFKCKKCGDNLSSEFDLQEHCYIHTNQPYECDNCGALFADLQRLQRHSRSHEADNQNYTSEDEVAENGSEREISTVHTTKPFHCDTCSASFKTKYHLNRHIVGHNGSKPYKCSECDEAFSRSDYLRKHILIHNSYNSNENSACNFVHPKTNVTYTSEFNKENEFLANHNAVIDLSPSSNMKQLTGNWDHRTVQSSFSSCDTLTSGKCGYVSELNSTIQSCSVEPAINASFGLNLSNYVNHNSSMCSTLRSSTLSTISNNGVSTETVEVCRAVNAPQQTVLNYINPSSFTLSTVRNNGLCTETVGLCSAVNTPQQTVLSYIKPTSSVLPTCSNNGTSKETTEVCSAVDSSYQTVLKESSRNSHYKCSNCPLQFTQQECLQAHSHIHADASLSTVKEHPRKNITSSTDSGVYKCDECGKVLSRKDNLLDHINAVHSDMRPYKCEECGRCLATKKALSSHTRKHLDNSVLCKICGKRYATPECLRLHIRIHTGEKPFKCSECPAAFARSQSFKMHFRIHSGEKPYKCTKCDAAFTSQKGLSVHSATHSNNKPYLCEICGSAFGHTQRLLLHRRLSHSSVNLKTYKCVICGASFTVSTNLKRHMRVHTGERPYKCAECGSSFTQKEHLKKHIRTMHD